MEPRVFSPAHGGTGDAASFPETVQSVVQDLRQRLGLSGEQV